MDFASVFCILFFIENILFVIYFLAVFWFYIIVTYGFIKTVTCILFRSKFNLEKGVDSAISLPLWFTGGLVSGGTERFI